ncbi:uncharacterized protein LOC136087111 [Hydra vulgaris]|uniref:Uncharacterized protein LOC136087111 n=1 Tax=Hydra vulgaris TaxID=6087 RepID=A0ABM4CUT1_HYDVU
MEKKVEHAPRNAEECFEVLQREWHNIPQGFITNLYESIPLQRLAGIEAKGGQKQRLTLMKEYMLAQNIKHDSKSFFAHARSKTKSTVKAGVLVKNDGVKVDSDTGITEEFNKPNIGRMSDCIFTVNDVRTKLSKLRIGKSAGGDDIGPKLLYNIQNGICVPFYLLFHKSLDDEVVPNDWNSANVIPLFKSVNYLEMNQAIVDSQPGFRKGKSCVTNLLLFLEQVTGFVDNGDCVDVIYLDFT